MTVRKMMTLDYPAKSRLAVLFDIKKAAVLWLYDFKCGVAANGGVVNARSATRYLVPGMVSGRGRRLAGMTIPVCVANRDGLAVQKGNRSGRRAVLAPQASAVAKRPW